MRTSPSDSERLREAIDHSDRRGVHFFALKNGAGSNRRLTFGVSIPAIGEAYRSIAVALVCASALIPSLLWAVRDRRVWPWDQAWYGAVSTDLWFAISQARRWWLPFMIDSLDIKPPGITWVGQFFVPLRGAFGSIEAALLFSVLLTQLIVLILVYRIAVRVGEGSRAIGLIAVAAAAGGQIFVGLSHQYMVEPLQCLAVAWTILIALRCDEWPRARTLIHLAAASLLGMLAKASTPLYVLVPAVFILFKLVRGRQPWDLRAEWQRTTSRLLVIASLGSGALGAFWYLRHYAAVLQHIRDSSSGSIALDYGFRAPWIQKYPVWVKLLDEAFLEPYLGWIVGALVLAAVVAIFSGRVSRAQWQWTLIAGLLSLAQIALVLFSFALNDAVEPRYLYGLLPYVAGVVAGLCAVARYRMVPVAVLVICIAQFAVVNEASFEAAPVLTEQFGWLKPIIRDAGPYQALTEVVRRTSTVPGYNIVAIEESWLNSISASFFASKNRLATGVKTTYTSLAYGEKDTSAAMKRIEEFAPTFVITLDAPYQSPVNFLNIVTLPVLRELESRDQFTRVPFPNKMGILVFERQPRVSAAHP